MVTRFRPIICYAALLTLLGGAPAVAATVSVTVTGAADERGQIIACLWRDGSNFPDCNKYKPAQKQIVRLSSPSTAIVFTDVAPGNYAVSVAHDRNLDGKVGTNFLGIPNEPVGLSNNVRPRFGPPKFSAASFRLTGDASIKITLGKP